MDTEQVIDRMLQCTAGQIVACNIVAGIDNGLIRRRLAKEAFDWLGRLAGFQPRYQTPRELVKLVFDSEEFKLIVKQWVSGHTKSLGTTYRRSSQFE